MCKVLYVDFIETKDGVHRIPYTEPVVNTLYIIAKTEDAVLSELENYTKCSFRDYKEHLKYCFEKRNGVYFGFFGSQFDITGKISYGSDGECAWVTARRLPRTAPNAYKDRFLVYDDAITQVVEPEFLGHIKIKDGNLR